MDLKELQCNLSTEKRTEENNKNISKALQYYQIVLKDYTETPVYKKAQERVKELETQGSQ